MALSDPVRQVQRGECFSGKLLRPPLNEGMYNTVQKGQVVPVKITVGCVCCKPDRADALHPAT